MPTTNDLDLIKRFESLEQENAALAGRVTRSERLGRRLMALCGLLVVGGTVIAAMGAIQVPKSIEAEEFVLKGADGKNRMKMLTLKDGTSALALFDAQGKSRMEFKIKPNGIPVFDLRDAEGDVRLAMFVDEKENTFIGLADGANKDRLTLRLNADGSSSLRFLDGIRVRAALQLDRHGQPELGFVDENGKERLEMDLTKDGRPLMVMRTKTDKVALGMVVKEDDNGEITVFGADGKAVFQAPAEAPK